MALDLLLCLTSDILHLLQFFLQSTTRNIFAHPAIPVLFDDHVGLVTVTGFEMFLCPELFFVVNL